MLPFLKLCGQANDQNWKCFPHFRGIHIWYYHIEYMSASSSSRQYLVKCYISNIMFFFFYHFLLRLSDNEIQIWCEMICIKFMWNHKFEVLFEMTYIKYSVKWYIPSIMWNDVYQVFSEMIYIRPRCDCEVHKEAQTKKSRRVSSLLLKGCRWYELCSLWN